MRFLTRTWDIEELEWGWFFTKWGGRWKKKDDYDYLILYSKKNGGPSFVGVLNSEETAPTWINLTEIVQFG